MNGAGMPRADFITSLVLIVFGAGMLWGSLEMPRFEQRSINPYSIPGIVPGILAGVILALGTGLLVRAIRQRGFALDLGGAGLQSLLQNPGVRRLGLAFFLTMIYAVGLVGIIPFWVATFVFVSAFIVLFEWPLVVPARRWLMTVLAGLQGALVSAAVTIVFQELFLVTLP